MWVSEKIVGQLNISSMILFTMVFQSWCPPHFLAWNSSMSFHGACRFHNTKIMSIYHGDDKKCSANFGFIFSLGFFPSANNSIIMCRLRESHLDCAIILSSPWPLISLVGLISKLYSSRTTIHFSLLPSGFGWVRMSFTALVGTCAIMWECRL